jgi:hypothetical protein
VRHSEEDAMRRLTLVAVAALVALGGVAVAGNQHGPAPGMEGTWLVKVLFAEGTPMETKLQYLQTFNHDGRTTLLLPTGGPEGYGETGDPRVGCMGEWKDRHHARGRVFDVMLLCLPTQQWEPTDDPTSYQELQFKATLLKGGNTWKGPFVISNYMTDGTQIFTGPGEMVATRMEFKPLP